MLALVRSLLSTIRGSWPSAPSHTQQLPCTASTHESTASSPPPVQERSDQLLSCHAILLGQPSEGGKLREDAQTWLAPSCSPAAAWSTSVRIQARAPRPMHSW